jgi:hypothetical protein
VAAERGGNRCEPGRRARPARRGGTESRRLICKQLFGSFFARTNRQCSALLRKPLRFWTSTRSGHENLILNRASPLQKLVSLVPDGRTH